MFLVVAVADVTLLAAGLVLINKGRGWPRVRFRLKVPIRPTVYAAPVRHEKKIDGIYDIVVSGNYVGPPLIG